jgi:carbonic anhydrase
MKKLIQGLLDFQRHVLPSYRETFARLALGQSPDCLFISCSDSRVVPNLFASTNPGDLFVMRNVGNLMPPSDPVGRSIGDESEAAALEFAISHLHVKDIIVCGHSECGAMKAILAGGVVEGAPNLTAWLRHGKSALERLEMEPTIGAGLKRHDRLSQLNVLTQLENTLTYPVVRRAVEAGELRLHGWWFDIREARVYAYEESRRQFVAIDETEGERLLERLETTSSRRNGEHAAMVL